MTRWGVDQAQQLAAATTLAPVWECTNGAVVYAEIEPAGSRWLPWPGRTSLWWYEVHYVEPDGTATTCAYDPGGSGGAYTLRRCIMRASAAVEQAALALEHGAHP